MPDRRTPDHILMTADTVGGVWTYALELAEALRPFGVKVALATMGAPLSTDQWLAVRQIDNVEVYESRYRLEWMDAPWRDVQAAGAWLLNLEARIRPDLIHLNNYAHGALDWQAPVLMAGHSCVLSWFAAVEGEVPQRSWRRYRRAVARGLRQADRVVAPTYAMLDALQTHYGSFGHGIVVYNGRRAHAFQPREKEPFLLAAGRLWDQAKNVKALQRVAPRLPWPICMAGANRDPDGERVRMENVETLGRIAPAVLAEWMGRASIFALPARYEPFGLTALEAGLAGCALVLGDIPSLREVWGDAAIFVSPDDHATLAAVLRKLIDDAVWRRRMARRARARALAYTPRRMARGYLDLYDALLRRSEAAPVTVSAPRMEGGP